MADIAVLGHGVVGSGVLEVLRVNRKYLQEIGMNQSERDVIESDPFAAFDEENRRIYLDMLKRAIETKSA